MGECFGNARRKDNWLAIFLLNHNLGMKLNFSTYLISYFIFSHIIAKGLAMSRLGGVIATQIIPFLQAKTIYSNYIE